MSSLQTIVAVLQEKVKSLFEKCEHFITDDEFLPVKNITYGLVTAILVAVVGALLSLIIRK